MKYIVAFCSWCRPCRLNGACLNCRASHIAVTRQSWQRQTWCRGSTKPPWSIASCHWRGWAATGRDHIRGIATVMFGVPLEAGAGHPIRQCCRWATPGSKLLFQHAAASAGVSEATALRQDRHRIIVESACKFQSWSKLSGKVCAVVLLDFHCGRITACSVDATVRTMAPCASMLVRSASIQSAAWKQRGGSAAAAGAGGATTCRMSMFQGQWPLSQS